MIVIGCSSLLTFLIVKSFGKISKISFPKLNFPRINFDWIKKKEKISAADYDFVIEYENGNPNPKLVPKKKDEAKKETFHSPLTKNNQWMVMAGVVVVGALVGYYVMKKKK
jgi:LPXTG-motif cell wall-anchored protein